MSGADLFGLVVSVLLLAYLVYALFPGRASVTASGIGQIALYSVVLTALAYPLGAYMARVYGGSMRLPRWLAAPERGFYRLVGTRADQEQTWKAYAVTALVFMSLFAVLLYLLLRLQGHLPLNPDGMAGVLPHIAANTTASFVTNTNWQYYGGETTMSYLSQMAGLAVQNFVSAALGMAVLVAVIRGFARRNASTVGNFWVDFYRSLVYVLLPLSVVLALLLVSQGVVQTFDGAATATTLEGGEQQIARGPAATQIAVKQLGTNGGGFYNSNSAVPFENPNGFTNFLELLAILLIPAAQVFMFGRMVGARRQALPIFGAMLAMFAIGVAIALPAEQHGSQVLRDSGVNIASGDGSSGGNLSDKEIRNGIATTVNWAVATTNASNGSVNGGHDALTATGGAVPIVNMFTGEVIFGGVGSGLYGMLFFVVIAVFVAGLMVGRTPEYLGKKIEAREIKLAAVGALFVPTMVLVLTAISVVTDRGLESIFNPAAHGFSEALYAYDSQSNNNGSAFAGYGATEFSALVGSIALWLGRFAPLVAALAIGGSLAAKKTVPASAGTFRTDGVTFAVLLVGVVILTAGLMIFPALTLWTDRGRPVAVRQSVLALVARSAAAVAVLTVVFGLAYPLLFTGFAQVVFPGRADGSLIERDGRVVGSRLAAQAFTRPEYFHPRPSATDPLYNAAGTTFANLGPTNPELAKLVRERIDAILELERPYSPGLVVGDIPVDAVTTSASGIDPHISPANARLQTARVAKERGLTEERVDELVDENTDGRSLGFLGEPGVNVLELNLALDEEAPQ